MARVGAAHIGVIAADRRIPIDCIAGTRHGVGHRRAVRLRQVDDLEKACSLRSTGRQPGRLFGPSTFRRKQDDLFLAWKKARIKDEQVGVGDALILGQKFDLVRGSDAAGACCR